MPECQTPFFLATELEDDDRVTIHFDAPPEAPTTRGFAGILSEGLNGATAAEVLEVPNGFYTALGLDRVISPCACAVSRPSWAGSSARSASRSRPGRPGRPDRPRAVGWGHARVAGVHGDLAEAGLGQHGPGRLLPQAVPSPAPPPASDTVMQCSVLIPYRNAASGLPRLSSRLPRPGARP